MEPRFAPQRPRPGAEKKDRPAEPSHHELGRSRGGWGTKVHVLVDGRGVPLGAYLTPGQAHEVHGVEPLLDPDGATPALAWYDPRAVAGDKGYSSVAVRERITAAGWTPVIPRHSNELARDHSDFDRELYRRRNVVERCIGRLKEFRRIATRYEKLATSFRAMLDLAFVLLYFRDLARAA
jgi:transposase